MSHLNTILLSLVLCFSFACNKASDSSLQDQLGIEQPIGSGGGSTLPNSALIKYAGDLQTISTSSVSANLTVKALDSSYEAMADVEVTFTLTSGSGTLSSSTVTTDSSGLASITYTGAATAEAVSIVASSSVGVVTFSMSVTSTVNSSDVLVKFSGDQQTISRNAVSAQFKVKALDSDFDPIQNVTVNYTIGSGTGTLSAASATTDVNGLAGVTYTAPNSNESVTIIATSSLGIVVFNLTVGSSGPGAYAALTFGGIVSSSVVSSTQIKVRFSPPNGGSGLYTYRIYEDSDFNTPVRTFTSNQVVDEGMFYTYTVSGLTPATAYTYSVRVYDALINEEDTNVLTSSSTTSPMIAAFDGIDTIDNMTTTTMRLNWTTHADAANYKIYNLTSGSPVFVATIAAPATSYTVTSLSPATTYIFRVRYENNLGYSDDNINDVSGLTVSPLVFAGISSVTNLTSTTLRLNWTHLTGTSTYKIYNVTSGTAVQIGSVTAPTAFYDVLGLTPGNTYIFRVRAQDSEGVEDTNVNDVSQAMPSITITHNGWTDVLSTGPRIDYNDIQTEPGRLRLKWKQSTSSGSAITSYNLYRATTSNGAYTKINGSAISPGVVGEDVSYEVDVSALAAGTAYYFQISVVVQGIEYFHVATTPIDHTKIRVIYPPNNTSFVHRWIANLDMCDEIGRGLGAVDGVDLTNSYRCLYNGLASTNGYYDLGHDMVVDNTEIGCNFSKAACTSHSVGATTNVTDCIDDAAPDGSMQAAQYSIFYNKTVAGLYQCYIQTSANAASPTWVSVTSLNQSTQISYLGNNYGSYIYGLKVGLPPLVTINQPQAWEVCQTQTQNLTIDGASLLYRKRLLRRKEWTAAAQWDPSFTFPVRKNLENGTSPNSCISPNSTNGNYNRSNRNWPSNIDWFYIEGIGTTEAINCRSRYGLQQMPGNVWEWTSDHLTCDGSRNCTSNLTPLFDSGFKQNWLNGDGAYYNTTTNGLSTFSYFPYNVSYLINNASYLTYYNPIVALPLVCNGRCSAGTDDNTKITTLGSGASIINYLSVTSDNVITLQPANSYAAFLSGGHSGNSPTSSVNTANIQAYTTTYTGAGGRCAFPVSN